MVERNPEELHILLVDDDPSVAEMMIEYLHLSGFPSVASVGSLQELWTRIEETSYDIILLDYRLPDGNGLSALDYFSEKGVRSPVVMVTGQGDERIAAQAIQRGAIDYLVKSGDYLVTLPALIRKTIRAYRLQVSMQRSLEQIRYQALLLSNVRDAVVVWNTEGEITYWNPAAQALYGWSAEERLGKPVGEVYLKAFDPVIHLPREQETAGGHIERQYISRNRQPVWVSSRITSLYDASGSHRIGFMDVSHDITQRKAVEKALQASEARYRAIVEDYQTEMICRFAPGGILTFANEVFCRYFDIDRDLLEGTNFLSFVPESHHGLLLDHLAAFNAGHPVAEMEHLVRLTGGEMRWLQRTDRAILDEQGEVLEFQSVARDITRRKMMEAQIQAAQTHLVHAARLAAIGEVASGVAHQINNPLTTIIAESQIIARELPEGHAARESVEAIEQAGWRLQSAVQHLLDFSRPAKDSLDLIQVNETLENALHLVGGHIESAGFKLEARLGDNLPVVYGNTRQLEDLWVNLLLMARDAGDEGIEGYIQIESSLGPGGVLVEVRDNGRCIPEELLGSVFEPDFIGSNIGRGTGMELSICREIVRQHKGQISVESSPGRDTIFRILLPPQAADIPTNRADIH